MMVTSTRKGEKMRYVCIVASIIWLLSGCSYLKKPASMKLDILPNTVKVDPSFTPDENRIYAVLNASETVSPGSRVMTQEFEKEFMGQGFIVVERSKLDRVLDEIAEIRNGSYNPASMAEIGKMTSVKVLVFVTVREFSDPVYGDPAKPTKPTKCTKINLNAKAVDIETGTVVWSGTINKKISWLSDPLYPCDCPALTYSSKAAGILAKKIRKALDKKKQ